MKKSIVDRTDPRAIAGQVSIMYKNNRIWDNPLRDEKSAKKIIDILNKSLDNEGRGII